MLKIHRQIFIENLQLTQAYCDLQLRNDVQDKAKLFRSYNPVHGGQSLFSFETAYFKSDIEPGINHCTMTRWLIDPTDKEEIVDDIFEEQIEHKKRSLNPLQTDKTYSGRILVSEIDCTVIDGASSVQSFGLVDTFDIPPVDTWFYIARTQKSRLLFAWIPGEYVHYANEAVEVNCVECINWADTWYPEGLEEYFTDDDNLLTTWKKPNSSFLIGDDNAESVSIWSQIKRLFGT